MVCAQHKNRIQRVSEVTMADRSSKNCVLLHAFVSCFYASGAAASPSVEEVHVLAAATDQAQPRRPELAPYKRVIRDRETYIYIYQRERYQSEKKKDKGVVRNTQRFQLGKG